MIIHSVEIVTKRNKTYLQAVLGMRGKNRGICYFAVPKEYKKYLSSDATPFLAAFLLPAMKEGEDIYIEGTISRKLYDSLSAITTLVTTWPMGFKPIKVSARKIVEDSGYHRRIGLFFSGGVDSWYTYQMNKKSESTAVTDFLFVHGFDIPLNENKFHRSVYKELKSAATKAQVKFIPVETNLREFIDPMLIWDYSHGGALAAVGLALSGGLGKVYLSGGMETAAVRPYGLHPHLDPLWSSETLTVTHFGDKARRIDKITTIVKDSLVRETLRVCWRNRNQQYNCCECEKCLRTMLVLYACGSLHLCKTFPQALDPERIRATYLFPNQYRYFAESLDVIRKSRKNDVIADAIQSCLNRNKNRSRMKEFTNKMRQEIGKWDSQHNNGRLFHSLSRIGFI